MSNVSQPLFVIRKSVYLEIGNKSHNGQTERCPNCFPNGSPAGNVPPNAREPANHAGLHCKYILY